MPPDPDNPGCLAAFEALIVLGVLFWSVGFVVYELFGWWR